VVVLVEDEEEEEEEGLDEELAVKGAIPKCLTRI
jgi:hypothetical protein